VEDPPGGIAILFTSRGDAGQRASSFLFYVEASQGLPTRPLTPVLELSGNAWSAVPTPSSDVVAIALTHTSSAEIRWVHARTGELVRATGVPLGAGKSLGAVGLDPDTGRLLA